MIIINDPSKLNYNDLIQALVDTACDIGGDLRKELIAYYKTLTREQLLLKAAKHGELYLQNVNKVSELEMKQREADIRAIKYVPVKQCKQVEYVKKDYWSQDEKIIGELNVKSCVKDAVVVSDGIIGVVLKDDKAHDKVMRVVKRNGYKGKVIFCE